MFLNYILSFFIFCVVLFFYLHVQHQLSTSNELEIYELDNLYKEKLEEIISLKQPVILNINPTNDLITNLNKTFLLKTYPAFPINILTANNLKISETKKEIEEPHLPLQLSLGIKLFEEDKDSIYYSEYNKDFLEETGIIKTFKYNDEIFRPSFTSHCIYDFISSSQKTPMPFKYEINYRNFFIITQGNVNVKLSPPKNKKYLYVDKNYDIFEFKSKINIWDVQPEFLSDYNKIKCLEVKLSVGKCICIPPYWFYSFQFEDNSSMISLKYRTYFNNIAILPDLCMNVLQRQNTTVNYLKKNVMVKLDDEIR